MSNSMIKHISAIFIILLLAGNLAGQRRAEKDRPVNFIILIGDGMGLSHLSIPYYFQDEKPIFSSFKNIGLVGTSSATHKVTESAAAATALFTGWKSYNSAIGVDKDTVVHQNLVEVLSELDYNSGVIATSSITDATPAGFYAHQASREYHTDIAHDLLNSEIDFFAGGGFQYFIDTTGRDLFKDHNMEVSFSKLNEIKKPAKDKRYGFLMAFDRMPAMVDGRGDYLPQATGIALDFLSGKEDGFILMVEGSQIDWASHSNNPEYLFTEMKDFEEAVSVAYEFARKDGNTIVIVTADHETGGFTLSAGGDERNYSDYNTIVPKFATSTHSASMVPLLAYGPGSESFTGIYENTAIFYKIIELAIASMR